MKQNTKQKGASITYPNNKRVYFEKYSDFVIATDAIKELGDIHYAAYYDFHGEPHMVLWKQNEKSIIIFGMRIKTESSKLLDMQILASEEISEERMNEILGFSK